MMPVLTRFADRLHSIPEYSDYRFIIAGAPSRSMEDYAPYIGKALNDPKNAKPGHPHDEADIRIIFGETQSVIRNAEAAIINSGTASLEAVLLGTPQVVGYILGSRLTYWIGRLIGRQARFPGTDSGRMQCRCPFGGNTQTLGRYAIPQKNA